LLKLGSNVSTGLAKFYGPWETVSMPRKRSANLADDDKGVNVHRTGRYQKAQQLKEERKKERERKATQESARTLNKGL
jgi:hypothetical protein